MCKRILVAVDGSEEATEALSFAATEWPDAELTALHVINPADSTTGAEGGFPGAVDQWYDSAEQRGERILREAAETIGREIDTRLEVGRPTATVLGVASGESEPGEDDGEPFDHVVLASRGRTGLSRVVLGSVAEGVMEVSRLKPRPSGRGGCQSPCRGSSHRRAVSVREQHVGRAERASKRRRGSR